MHTFAIIIYLFIYFLIILHANDVNQRFILAITDAAYGSLHFLTTDSHHGLLHELWWLC